MLRTFTGQRASVWLCSNNGPIISSGTTAPNTKYFVMDKAEDSDIPVPTGVIFVSPRTGQQITLKAADRLQLIEDDRFCKTSLSFELSTSAVDASTDCFPGAQISDGVTGLSGSLSGLWQYDQETEDFVAVNADILNKFVAIIDDSGGGSYTVNERDDNHAYLHVCLNTDAKPGQISNWLFAPVVLVSTSVSLENTDPQSLEISFTLGYGTPVIYRMPA